MQHITHKLLLVTGTACLSIALLACPANSLSAKAYAASATETAIQSRAADIQYCYKIENGKMYKRLYNYSVGVWIGDWIYVCDYPG